MSGDNKPRRVKPHEISGYMAGYYSEDAPVPSERTERHTRREAFITRDGAHIIESEVEITERRRPAPPAQPDDPPRSRGFIQRFLRGDW